MSFLLDTNVLCEPAKMAPNAGVLSWFGAADEDGLFLSTVSLAELCRGVLRLPAGGRRQRLERWVNDEVVERFHGRILPVDSAVAKIWGRIMADADAAGQPIGALDGFIAATATHHQLTLVTRNTRDFAAVLPKTLNPWLE